MIVSRALFQRDLSWWLGHHDFELSLLGEQGSESILTDSGIGPHPLIRNLICDILVTPTVSEFMLIAQDVKTAYIGSVRVAETWTFDDNELMKGAKSPGSRYITNSMTQPIETGVSDLRH